MGRISGLELGRNLDFGWGFQELSSETGSVAGNGRMNGFEGFGVGEKREGVVGVGSNSGSLRRTTSGCSLKLRILGGWLGCLGFRY